MRLIDADALKVSIEYMPIYSPDVEWVRKAAMIKVDEAPTIGGWISVKDRLPEYYKWVLCYTKHEDWESPYRICYLIPFVDDTYPPVWSQAKENSVTHWRELPEGPED